MFDTLGDIWNSNQQRLAQQGVKPGQTGQAGTFGALIATGMNPQDAYIQAATLVRAQEASNIAQQKQQQEEMQQHQFRQLADYVRSNPNATNQEIAGAALQMGVNPANVPAFVATIGTQEKLIEDTIRGGGPTIYTNRAGQFTGSRAAVDGIPTNVGGVRTNNTAPNNANMSKPDMRNAGLDYDNMTDEQRLQIADTPVQDYAPKQTGNSKIKASTDEFIQYSDQFRPKSMETPTLKDKEIDKKSYHKFLESTIAPTLKATQELDVHLDEILDASKKFTTGSLADHRLAAKKLGTFLGIDNAEEVAAGELIEKASAKMVLDFAKLMKGVVSDKDIAFLNKMVPTLMTTPEGNKQIVQYFKRINEHNRAYARGASRYFQERGHVNDFAEVFDEYTQSKPIFAEEIAEQEAKEEAQAKYKADEEYARKHGLL